MRKWKKVLIAEQEAKLDAKQDLEVRAFSPDINAQENGTWEAPETRRTNYKAPSYETEPVGRINYGDSSYEMRDTTKKEAKTQEWV